MERMMNLLLISNSTLHGSGYLDHCADEIKDFLGTNIKKVAFVPYARPSGITHDEYTAKARERYEKIGFMLKSVHEVSNPVELVKESEALFIGGGNSFVLLHDLQKSGLIPIIREKVKNGMPYIGTSAGSNVACPSIKTTNDMPIHEVDNFDALDLVPFQINPHYLDPDPNSTHKGETRETRISEFLKFNDKVVVGLREGCLIRINGAERLLKGSTNARVFIRGEEPKDYQPVCTLDFLF
jgi:dipeptidase E